MGYVAITEASEADEDGVVDYTTRFSAECDMFACDKGLKAGYYSMPDRSLPLAEIATRMAEVVIPNSPEARGWEFTHTGYEPHGALCPVHKHSARFLGDRIAFTFTENGEVVSYVVDAIIDAYDEVNPHGLALQVAGDHTGLTMPWAHLKPDTRLIVQIWSSAGNAVSDDAGEADLPLWSTLLYLVCEVVSVDEAEAVCTFLVHPGTTAAVVGYDLKDPKTPDLALREIGVDTVAEHWTVAGDLPEPGVHRRRAVPSTA